MHLSELTHPNQLHGLSVPELEQIAAQFVNVTLRWCPTAVGIWAQVWVSLNSPWLCIKPWILTKIGDWDVGHQAYPHKLITGRYGDFRTLRQQGGVAGYLKRCESDSTISVPVTPAPRYPPPWAWRSAATVAVNRSNASP